MHPTRQEEIAEDHDGILNRNNDIAFSDRSHKEEEYYYYCPDYVDLVTELIKLAKEKGAKDEVINNLMNQQTPYHGQALKTQT